MQQRAFVNGQQLEPPREPSFAALAIFEQQRPPFTAESNAVLADRRSGAPAE